jgi:uncharacterized protein
MKNYRGLKEFVSHYYMDKDIMHDLSHINRVIKRAENLKKDFDCDFDLICHGAYFHGFIYKKEDEIRAWLRDHEYKPDQIKNIIKVAWESQKNQNAESIEGKILHDAHMIEGGKTFLITKSLITGSVRGQSLEETIKYIEDNILDQGMCYTNAAKEVHKEALAFAKVFIDDLKEGLYL